MSPLATDSYVQDMTSDTATIPTDEMFDIMKQASRGDDVFAVTIFSFPLSLSSL